MKTCFIYCSISKIFAKTPLLDISILDTRMQCQAAKIYLPSRQKFKIYLKKFAYFLRVIRCPVNRRPVESDVSFAGNLNTIQTSGNFDAVFSFSVLQLKLHTRTCQKMHSSKTSYTTDPSRLEFLSHRVEIEVKLGIKDVLFSIAF